MDRQQFIKVMSEAKLYDQIIKGGLALELDDLVDAVHWAKAQPFVDSTRIGITGASVSAHGPCRATSLTSAKPGA